MAARAPSRARRSRREWWRQRALRAIGVHTLHLLGERTEVTLHVARVLAGALLGVGAVALAAVMACARRRRRRARRRDEPEPQPAPGDAPTPGDAAAPMPPGAESGTAD